MVIGERELTNVYVIYPETADKGQKRLEWIASRRFERNVCRWKSL